MLEVEVVFELAVGAGGGRLPAGVPTLGVDAIDGDDLELARFKLVGERRVHALVFPLEEAALRGGEDDHARAAVAEDEQLHVAAEHGAEPTVIFAIHSAATTL